MNGQSKYKDFWNWFEQNGELLFNFEDDIENVFDLLENELHKINEHLTFEFGPIKDNKREFIITADGIRDAFYEVENLYNHKPELEKWIIIKYRQRKNHIEIKMNDITLSMEDIYFRLFKDDSKVGILVFIKDYDKEKYGQMAFVLLDAALGEYDMETKVGAIEFFDVTSEHFSNALQFNTLAENFDAVYLKINGKE